MGALEAARTAQRLSAAPVAIERRRPAHPAAPAPTPATRTSFLETVFACSRLSYIMRSSVSVPEETRQAQLADRRPLVLFLLPAFLILRVRFHAAWPTPAR